MTDTKDSGGPAFPNNVKVTNEEFAELRGMTLRDYFAAKALNSILGVLVAERRGDVDKVIKVAAETAYKMAEAMLEARK